MALLLSLPFSVSTADASCSKKWANRFENLQSQADVGEIVGEGGALTAGISPLFVWFVGIPVAAPALAIGGAGAIVVGFGFEGIKAIQMIHIHKTLSVFLENYSNGIIASPNWDGRPGQCLISNGDVIPCTTVEAMRLRALSKFVGLVQRRTPQAASAEVLHELDDLNEKESICQNFVIPTEQKLAREVARSLNSKPSSKILSSDQL